MKKADLVLKSNAVFTSLEDEPFKGGVAIEGNRILAVEKGDSIDKYIGPSTEVHEYQDKLIMPGFIDSHTHYFIGAVSSSDHICDVTASTSEEECVEMIKQYADTHPHEKRILGIGWFPAYWDNAPLPSKLSLDAAIPDRPVYLISADVHTFWMNTKALEEAGITADMKPESGEVCTFEGGELSGILLEPEAYLPAMDKAMEFDRESMKKIYKDFLANIAASGVTSITDMTAYEYSEAKYNQYKVVKEMEDAGEMTARLHFYTKLGTYTDFSEAKKLEKIYCSGIFRMSGLKGFVDGVTSTYTGLLLEPYADKPDTTGIGVPLAPKEDLERTIIAANHAGLAVRLHCIADGSVRMALDMFEASRKVNGNHGLKNAIEHIENIHPDDIPRFAELDIIPSMQPYHLTLDVNEKLIRMGEERCRWEWPHKTILEKGGKLVFSTDYPVVDFNPFLTLYAAVTRCDDDGNPTGINPEERVSLAEAIKAYTASAADIYDRSEELGTLEEGKLADVVVINKNLFAIDLMEIQRCQIDLTIMDGKIVYERKLS